MGLSSSMKAKLVRDQVIHRRGAVPSVRAWSDLIDRSLLRELGDGYRFVWWPSLISDDKVRAVLTRVVESGPLASRHREVPEAVSRGCATVVPGARRVAGTFLMGSGPNCVGTGL